MNIIHQIEDVKKIHIIRKLVSWSEGWYIGEDGTLVQAGEGTA